MATYTQANRLVELTTPLGENVLLLQGFTGRESISQPFHFDLDLASTDVQVAFDRIVGQRVTLILYLDQERTTCRYINGFVSRFAQGESDERFTYYRAEIVPWLWFLTRTADCRIFQDKTVPEIIEQVFKDLGFTDFKNNLRGTYPKRVYCVQYRETAFNFVSRLMEQYGMFYFFEHEQDKHTLVLADRLSAHEPCPEQPKARYDYSGGAQLGDEDVITSWHMEQELQPGKYALSDYNFETPNTSLEVNVSSTVKVDSNSKYEVYDYPGEYLKKNEGDTLVKLRMEEEESGHKVVHGSSTCRAFVPGYRFDLTGHHRQDMNSAYVLTEVQHAASIGSDYVSASDAEENYSNSFICMPHKVPFRPPRVTPKPVVQGPQTAVIVGKKGEEIWTDKYGRVKVQFHWDRYGKDDENSSCWIRVSQNWAGKRWGGIFIPRLGQEVIVEFLEGDPDQPIITGRVYNAEQMPPYELPTNQTQSGIKSRSSKKGETVNFNELRFEDKKDSEEIYLHAEKDFNRVVENNDTLKVGFDKKDPGDQTIDIYNSRTETVHQGNETITIKKGNRDVQIDMGNDTLTIKMGNQTTKLNMGKSTTQAMQSIELKVGANSIKIDQTGITLKGIMIKIQGDAMTQVKAPMTQVNGDAMLQLKGGITMIG